ncbi:MAG: hypothetical protein ISS48_00185 [Candidatus Aenigmarchaeota archaeon]|nr:hypothetical protein [Candidatus Aenigmarchaeota archaeon]
MLSIELIKFICKNEGLRDDDEFSKRGIVLSPRILIFLFGFYRMDIAFLIIGIGAWGVFLLDSYFWFKKIPKNR